MVRAHPAELTHCHYPDSGLCYGFQQQQRSERASRNRTAGLEYLWKIEMPGAVNEVVYNTSISLNRVFVFESVH